MGEKRRRDPGRAQAYAARAKILAAQAAFGPALEEMVHALELAPEVDSLWAQFGDLIRFFNFRHPLDPRLRGLLGRALEHPAVDPGDLVRPISSTALSRDDPFDDELLLRLLEETVIRDPRLEALIVAERRRALSGESVPLERLVAIAHQCFNTEYVFAESDEERRGVASLVPGSDPRRLALYAAYRPLSTLAESPTAPESLVRRQILEPAEEARLRASISTLGASTSAISAAVRAQYEENPYPRWRRLPAAIAPEHDAPSTVLIAGCGTGQHALATAMRMPRAKVLAIDLSRTSLAYAKRKTLELGVSNIEYAQADLLTLKPDIGRFARVEASGVLHHLEDPLEGWRSLAALVEPGGTMRIGLYSELGRRAIVRARSLIAERSFPATAEGIRACRGAIVERAEDELLGKIVRNEDFYSMSGCRDLLFHVQEHRLSLPQVKQMIDSLGLRFTGFEFADSGITIERYKARFSRDSGLLDLDNWHRLEEEHPDTFARMYQFGVRKAG
jgi:2-polyprenyl-3-methyl-5-hydroxy-6-metoxy-1,4-benzoquinol methylase